MGGWVDGWCCRAAAACSSFVKLVDDDLTLALKLYGASTKSVASQTPRRLLRLAAPTATQGCAVLTRPAASRVFIFLLLLLFVGGAGGQVWRAA